MESLLASIPYLQLHDLELLDFGSGTARLGRTLRPEMTSHVGILHARFGCALRPRS